MSPVLNTCLAVWFMLTGAGAAAVMLELKGKSGDRTKGVALIRLHRILGYTFVALFSIMVVVMIRKAGATVASFMRFEVGEGIEKKQENFADEVMAQVKG